ncbi:hypothetical protein Droror1_Dr00012629 [Drosera rotundifolia]
MSTNKLSENLITKKNMSSNSTSATSTTLSSLASLIKLLPTGTVFVFEFLSPVLSNNGKCHVVNKILTAILIGISGLACAFATFTDSYTDKNGETHYGIVTVKGLWTFGSASSRSDEEAEETSNYKLRLGDFVHAGLSLLVFATVAILDHNTVECFFPSLVTEESTMMAVLPVVVGTVASGVFMVFPSTRHGIGYAKSDSSSSSSSSS